MLLKIYATSDHDGSRAGGPSLIVADDVVELPRHPTGKAWRYLATISDADLLVVSRRGVIRAALAGRGYFASRWAMGVGAAQSRPSLPHDRHIASEERGMSKLRQRAEQAFRIPS